MNYLQQKVLANLRTKELIGFLALFGLAVITPALLHSQWITGPIMNAIFVITLFLLGVKRALAIALVPSLIALSSGTLPAILAPAIPFIMIGNVVYILSINYIYGNFENKEKSYWLAIAIGSGLKFAFLFLSSNFLVRLFTSESVAQKAAQMMTWAQFVTAIVGGMIAWVVLRWLKKV